MGEFVRKKLRLRDDILSRWIMDPITDTGSLYAFMHQRKTADTYLIQDIYTPIEKTARFVQNVLNEYRISPLWLDPIKPAPCKQKNSPHYFPERQELLVDVGIWGRPHGEKWSAEKGRHRFNQLVSEACGVHMAYAAQDLTQDEFGEIYDLGWNEQLRERFHAQDLFLDLYSKIGSDKQTEADRREGTKRFLNSWDPKGLNGWFLKKIIGSMIQ